MLRIPEPDWYQHRVFKGPDTDINLHVLSLGCPEIDRMGCSGTGCVAMPPIAICTRYTKLALAAQEWKYVQNCADPRTAVIEEILARARAGRK